MQGFLLDTNVLSELTRPRPSPRVEDWLEKADDSLLYLSVISLTEILRGVSRLPASKNRTVLETWVRETLQPWFQGRILPVTQKIAERLGRLAGEQERIGRTLPFADGLIAATALENGLSIVTRNVKNFTGLDLPILNPWDDPL